MPDIIKQRHQLSSESVVMIPGDLPQLAILPAGGGKPLTPREQEQKQGQEELQRAQQESRQLLQGAQSEAEELRQQAREQGHADGAREKKAEIEQCIAQVEKLMETLQTSLERFMERYENELTDFAIEITEKVILKRLSRDDMELAGLVQNAVASVKKAEWIRVEVSDKLPQLIEHLQKELERAGKSGMEVAGRAIPVDSCFVRTPDASINASVGTQLENLKQYFDMAGEKEN